MTDINKQKVLSLCIPTYNRGWCVKKQIDRLMSCPEEIMNKIEVIISDNNSTDDTKDIIESAIQNGFNCKYIRQKTNIGADPNFIACFRTARAKYVWLLGDDDFLIIESLIKIVKLLDVNKEFGLLHIYQKNDLKIDDIIYEKNKNIMLKYVSYFITFISANIVNRKYVANFNFEKNEYEIIKVDYSKIGNLEFGAVGLTKAGAAAGPLTIKILCLYFLAPALISLGIHMLMKKAGWVKAGDMKLEQ